MEGCYYYVVSVIFKKNALTELSPLQCDHDILGNLILLNNAVFALTELSPLHCDHNIFGNFYLSHERVAWKIAITMFLEIFILLELHRILVQYFVVLTELSPLG